MQRIPAFQDLKSQTSNLRSRSESTARQLRAWADHLQNTDIEGQRYLNDSTRDRYEQQSRARAFDERLKDMIAEDKRRREGAGGAPDAA